MADAPEAWVAVELSILAKSVRVEGAAGGRGGVKIEMIRAKLHREQQIDNKCAGLKRAIKRAERTSLIPSDEYSNYFRS